MDDCLKMAACNRNSSRVLGSLSFTPKALVAAPFSAPKGSFHTSTTVLKGNSSDIVRVCGCTMPIPSCPQSEFLSTM